MLDLSALNPAQREAVTAPDGPVLVVAGAGSGKTRTIVHRLAWLAEQGVDPASMLLLTFTRKASREMLSRAADLLGYSLGGVQGGTFHAFAFSVLRRRRPAWAPGPVTVMDGSDSAAALQQCRDELKIGKRDRSFPKTQAVLALLSKARNKETPVEEILRRESPHLLPYADDLIRLGEAYREYRRAHSLLDYDDLLFELEALLRGEADDPGLAEYMRDCHSHIMVDEYQDTNRVQARIVRLLAGERGNVMAVGDDAQSIYAFRGADVRNILEFPALFPETRLIRLEENYRSRRPVLDVANAVLAGAREGFCKTLFTRREESAPPRPVRLVRPLSDLTQAVVVAGRIEALLAEYKPCEIAVLFRAGYQSYHLEVALAKRGIRFRKYGGLRYTEAIHVRDVIAFIRLAINPLDMPSFQRIAALCKGVGPKTAARMYEIACRGDADALRAACARYPEMLADMTFLDRVRVQDLTPAGLLELTLDHYQPRLESRFPEDWPRRRQGLEELAHIASSYADLEQFVADLSLDAPGAEENAAEEESVVLSTIHSAKGLEWDAVILLDLVEDRFPSRHALIRPEDFEEERRLMYVACTRARELLELCVPCTLYSRQNGGTELARPSPFVADLPAASLEEWRESYSGAMSRRWSGSGDEDGDDAPSFRLPRAGQKPGVFAPATCSRVSSWTRDSVFAPACPARDDREDDAEDSAERCEERDAGGESRQSCGYCRHKIFGRGKIVEYLPPDKCRVNFPGFGLKVIMSAFLHMENE